MWRRGHAVIHAGPHKTGSTHVQQLLYSEAPRLMAHGWQWPHTLSGSLEPELASPKSLANLAHALGNLTCDAGGGA